MAASWWAVITSGPGGGNWLVIQAGSAAQARSVGAGVATGGNKITAVKGPYATRAAAEAAGRAAASGSPPPSSGAGTGAPSSGNGTVTQSPGCGPQAIYTALLAAGFSTVQAIGAMANAINESRLNPETPAGDGGHSFGLWQFNDASYPDAPHPTGNCAQDITRAVNYLKTHVSGSALAGNSGAEVASNFAANFERCVGCQKGGSQNAARAANAATVEGWITSGKWPTSSGGAGGGGSSGGSGGGSSAPFPGDVGATLTGNTSKCLVGGGTFVPCLLNASQARALIGGMLLAAGALIMATGLALVTVQSVGGQAVKATPVGAVLSGLSRAPGKAAAKAAKAPPTPAKDKLPPVISE